MTELTRKYGLQNARPLGRRKAKQNQVHQVPSKSSARLGCSETSSLTAEYLLVSPVSHFSVLEHLSTGCSSPAEVKLKFNIALLLYEHATLDLADPSDN